MKTDRITDCRSACQWEGSGQMWPLLLGATARAERLVHLARPQAAAIGPPSGVEPRPAPSSPRLCLRLCDVAQDTSPV